MIVSIIPIIGYWPIKKLKKLRKITIINGIIFGLAYLTSFMMFKTGFSSNASSLPIISMTPVTIIVNCILVYNWVKDHNKKLNTT